MLVVVPIGAGLSHDVADALARQRSEQPHLLSAMAWALGQMGNKVHKFAKSSPLYRQAARDTALTVISVLPGSWLGLSSSVLHMHEAIAEQLMSLTIMKQQPSKQRLARPSLTSATSCSPVHQVLTSTGS